MTDPLAYPDQDPAELRAKAVQDVFDKIRLHLRGFAVTWSQYASRQADYLRVTDARYRLDRSINDAQHAIQHALEEAEVQVVHDKEVV